MTTLDVHQTYSVETDNTRGAARGWTQSRDQLASLVDSLQP